MPARQPLQIAALAALLATPSVAGAWQISDPIHADCHERLSQRALDEVGYAADPTPPSGDDADLPNSLQFDVRPYDANIYAWSLLIGARYPDLHGAPDFDFDDLATTHNAAGDQGEHCLRRGSQDGGSAADEAALADCRETIRSLYWKAVGTLGEGGSVDPTARVPVDIYMPAHGTVHYPLPALYFYGGRALHAVQDSFTHTYRTADWRRVQHVFNWVEQVECTLDEAVDGHGHESVFDACDDALADNAARMDASRRASVDLLRALTEPGDRATREQRLETFFDDWMRAEPGCTASNAYCDNEAHAMVIDSGRSDDEICGGCSSAGTRPPGWSLALVALVAWRRRCRRRGSSPSAGVAVALVSALMIGLIPIDAAAHQPGYHTELRASMSVQNPAYAVTAAGAYAWERFELGAFAELNPWYSVERGRMNFGSTNLGGFFHYLHPLGKDVDLRAGLGGGVAILNEDLIGSKAGTTGPYLNLRLLGVVWRSGGHWAFSVDGFDLALPVPQMVGWPILYAQHRVSFGLHF